jgi:tripartite-type tricarboxylate transporter receptor subunit TctC
MSHRIRTAAGGCALIPRQERMRPRERSGDRIASMWILVGATMLAAAGAAAQTYPAKPVRIIVPFGPGGPSDLLARQFGQKFAEAWGQPFVIENRGGANGMVGADIVAKSPPDGYTLVLATNGTHGMNSSLFAKVPYDPIKDFAPITRLALQYFLLVSHPSLPVRSVTELIRLARAQPGQIVWAYGGAPTQLGAELFRKEAKVNVLVIPYKGNAPAVTSVVSGEAQVVFGGIAHTGPQVKAGRLRALGVAGSRRSEVLPEIPTIAESGLPGFEVSAWYGLLAPAGTPRAILDRLNGEAMRILKLPDVQRRLQNEAFETPADTPEGMAAVIRAELSKWASVVKEAGIKPQ